MERITYHCELRDAGGHWIKFVTTPPEGVELPCKNQLDAKACIEKWDPPGNLKWRIVRIKTKTSRQIVRTLG